MIRPTIKVTDNTDPQLALQTATAYFLIREIPSSTVPVLTIQQSLLEQPTTDQSSIDNGNQVLSKASKGLSYLSLLFMRIVNLVCTGIHISRTRGIHYNLHRFSKISVGSIYILEFFNPLVDLFLFIVVGGDSKQPSQLLLREDIVIIFVDQWNFIPCTLTDKLTLHTLIRF